MLGYYIKSAPADAVAAMVRLETAVSELATIGQQTEALPALLSL